MPYPKGGIQGNWCTEATTGAIRPSRRCQRDTCELDVDDDPDLAARRGLGHRILRTETAALTIVALLQYTLGDLGGDGP